MVLEKFKSELKRQGLKIEQIDSEGLVYISHNEIDLTINLDNLRKDFERDRDETRIVDFVETLKNQLIIIPDWGSLKDKIFIGFASSETDFVGFVNEKIGNQFRKVFTLHFNNQIRWISEQQLRDWNISLEELKNQANTNLSELLNNSEIEIEDIDGHQLGLINCTESALKSSLVFSQNLKEKVEKEFGWPINVVIPVRDFCYLFAKKDFEYFANRIGPIVVEEYTQSGYPITTEILEISDSGVRSIGEYPVE